MFKIIWGKTERTCSVCGRIQPVCPACGRPEEIGPKIIEYNARITCEERIQLEKDEWCPVCVNKTCEKDPFQCCYNVRVD